MIVAEAARDRSLSRKILFDEWPHHVALKALLMIDHVIGNADGLRYTTRVVHVVEGTAAALHRLRHAPVPCESPLFPKLHGQADDLVALGAQHGRDGGGVNSARHGDGDGLCISHRRFRRSWISFWLLAPRFWLVEGS